MEYQDGGKYQHVLTGSCGISRHGPVISCDLISFQSELIGHNASILEN